MIESSYDLFPFFGRLKMCKRESMVMEKRDELRRLMRCWISFWRTCKHMEKNKKKSGTRPPESTRRSSMEKEGGEGVKALTGAGEKETQKPVAAVQAGAGEKNAQKPAVVEEVARPVSLPPEQPPGLEVVPVDPSF